MVTVSDLNAFGIAMNGLITIIVLAQSCNVLKLSQNPFLDSSILRFFYKVFFVSNFLMVSILLLLNLQSFNLVNLVFSLPMLIITIFHFVRSHNVTGDSIENDSAQLLLESGPIYMDLPPPSKSTISTGKLLESAQVTIYNSRPTSLDISPLSSVSNSKITSAPMKQKTSSFSAPILATLMSSETVMAMDTNLQTPTIEISKTTSVIQLTIATVAVICFLTSQLIYSISIFKTNLYTQPKKQMTIFAMNSLVAILMLCNFEGTWLLQFALIPPWIKVFVPLVLLVHSMTCFILQFLAHKSSLKSGFSEITVYNSIHSPLLTA